MNFYFLTAVALIILLGTKDTLDINFNVLVTLISIILLMMIIYRIKFERFLTLSDNTSNNIIDKNKKRNEEILNQSNIDEKINDTFKRLQ
jgi:hypothetical protein